MNNDYFGLYVFVALVILFFLLLIYQVRVSAKNKTSDSPVLEEIAAASEAVQASEEKLDADSFDDLRFSLLSRIADSLEAIVSCFKFFVWFFIFVVAVKLVMLCVAGSTVYGFIRDFSQILLH